MITHQTQRPTNQKQKIMEKNEEEKIAGCAVKTTFTSHVSNPQKQYSYIHCLLHLHLYDKPAQVTE